MLNDNIPHLDVLLTLEGGTIFVCTITQRGADWLNEHYRACCGSPGNCGCGADSEQESWESGTKRETWLCEGYALQLLDAAGAAGLNADYLHAEKIARSKSNR